MPPTIPLFTLDYKGKTSFKGVSETRSGMFFAEVPLKNHSKISDDDRLEFGKIVYGPARQKHEDARNDYRLIESASNSGPKTLRRLIAILSPLGGTKSHPSPAVWPVQAGAPRIHVQVGTGNELEIHGVRRPNVSAYMARGAPELVIERVIDVVSDLLSCVVDSQLGILPSIGDLEGAVRFALARQGGAAVIRDIEIRDHVNPLIKAMRQTEPWSVLKEADSETDDREVIHNFLLQFLDKARRADELGERKQLKRFKKEIRTRKKHAHTVFVKNLPSDVSEDQVFSLFNSVSPNAIYKVHLPRTDTGESKGFAFVICRSRKATDAVLARTNWTLSGSTLLVAPREEPDEIESLAKRSKPALPAELEEAVVRAVLKHPGCNASQIPRMVQNLHPDLSLEPDRFGFRNLTHALQSVNQIYLEHSNRGNARRPVYFVYPK